ncbi:INPP4A family protein [Megaselia abdita]
MRFNKNELIAVASLPSNKFEKEGVLLITEKQEGFFRRTEVNFPRWCKLRGNLLFYLKDHDPFSTPVGVIVLENCRPVIRNEFQEADGYVFYLEFSDGLTQRIAAETHIERSLWIGLIQVSSYSYLNKQLISLQEQIYKKMGNQIEKAIPVIAEYGENQTNSTEIDLTEVPLCESSLACDNLLCDGHGRAPNPSVVVQISNGRGWRQYGRTEIIERSSNPQFVCTICFRASHGINSETLLRFIVYDVREKISQTSVPLGFAEIKLGIIQDTTRLRIPLKFDNNNVGFITIASWSPESDKKPLRSPAKVIEQQHFGHRRSQSLPPKLGVKLFVPNQSKIHMAFANAKFHAYRLHSGLGGDISVHEYMLESKLCYAIPQQLLSIWILREKELLQEISGMGELGGDWRRKQMDLLDKHLKLLKDYSQAKQNLQQYNKSDGEYFKRSAIKTEEALEFVPVNLHLQRMWAHNDTLKRSGVLDIVSVGAFTRHSGKSKTGGLIKLLQHFKDSPTKNPNGCKVQAANDAVQAIKQLRKEIVDIMSQLLCLAKSKNPKGMLGLCNEMVTKTRALLNIWEPSLVEEAFDFIEQHRILEEPDNALMPMSPFRKITQQLTALDLKSPDLEDFATPLVAPPDLWPKAQTQLRSPARSSLRMKSPSATDINAIFTIQNSMQQYNEQLAAQAERMHQSLPPIKAEVNFSETHFDVNGEVTSVEVPSLPEPERPQEDPVAEVTIDHEINESKKEILYSSTEFDVEGYVPTNCSIVLGQNGAFLDTKMMSSSPSANYYRPTEEPEPLDLTQLNIEASVMCLVSKVKFLCGRCGSPAIRLRHPKNSMKRSGFGMNAPDVVTSQPLPSEAEKFSQNSLERRTSLSGKDLNLALTQAVGEVTRKLKKGNKFTDGLDLSMTTDWASELRPSMRKLRHAMDGLLKTARLMHSVQRLQQDSKKISTNLAIMYRRDVCFSQALTSLVTSLMAKLWGTSITPNFIEILKNLGPLAYFEGLLSLYGGEIDMWGDMCIAIEDLHSVNFNLMRSNLQRESSSIPMPRLTGSRNNLTVFLPVPESVYCILPTKEMVTFKVTPVFFNIGINEKATLSETLGYTREQHRSNWDNFDRLKLYFIRYKKLNLIVPDTPSRNELLTPIENLASNLLSMEDELRANPSKNVKVLHLAEDISRAMYGLRFTSCKSAKDRTGMAVTLEQCRVLQQEFHLAGNTIDNVLNIMRRWVFCLHTFSFFLPF